MNKEEILEKSRKEKSDEGLIAAENQGRKIGIGEFCGVFVFIILFNFFTVNRIMHRWECFGLFLLLKHTQNTNLLSAKDICLLLLLELLLVLPLWVAS